MLKAWLRGGSLGSFPFMFVCTALMFWGVLKPIERRATLFLTGLLGTFMVAEKTSLAFLLKSEGYLYMQMFGAFLWFSADFFGSTISKIKNINED
jgi:hypothetical protein